MKPRVGFLGTGWIGRNRMGAMLATGAVEAAAICDPSPECLAEARRLAPGACEVPDLAAMLELGLDGIVIATPSALHADQTVRALESGAAVFCQKPLGRTADEVREAVTAARTADRLLAVDLSYRHTAGMRAIAEQVRSGALGHVFAIDLTFHNAYGPDKPWFYDPKLSGGGCTIDLGVHLIDLALWVLEFPEVRNVTVSLLAKGRPLGADQVEDYAIAMFQAGRAQVRLACSWRLHAGVEAQIEAAFYGTQGGVALRNVAGSFYDFTAERFTGTRAVQLTDPSDDWGGRGAVAWAEQLAICSRFDTAAEQILASAEIIDRIYVCA